MENKIIMGLILALVIIPTVIASIKEEGYFTSLAVTGDTYLAGQLRVDGNTHFYGNIYSNDKKGFTGICPSIAKHIYENGILVGCLLPEKWKKY